MDNRVGPPSIAPLVLRTETPYSFLTQILEYENCYAKRNLISCPHDLEMTLDMMFFFLLVFSLNFNYVNNLAYVLCSRIKYSNHDFKDIFCDTNGYN